jgi:hypothetical protein
MTTATSGILRPPAIHTRTNPLPLRLTLAAQPLPGSFAGAWWPRTRRPATELGVLVAGLASRGVVVTRLSLSVTDWDSAPGRLRLDDRDVRLNWFAYLGSHTLVVGHGDHEMTLLVVAPEATETSAVRAMTFAAKPGRVVDRGGIPSVVTNRHRTSGESDLVHG